jgi:hypothetical protein
MCPSSDREPTTVLLIGRVVRHSKLWQRMSALGHKRTSSIVQPMSAYPRKRLSIATVGMSALCHKRTHALQRDSRLIRQIGLLDAELDCTPRTAFR